MHESSTQFLANAHQAGLASSQIVSTIQQVAMGTTQRSDSVTKTAISIELMTRAIAGVAQGAQEQSISVNKAASITAELNLATTRVNASAEKVKDESGKTADAA